MKAEQEFHVQLDQIVPEYQSPHWIVRHLFWSRLRKAAEMAGETTGRMLDAGCGSGLLLKLLAETVPAQRLYGIDLNTGIEKLQVKEGCTVCYGDIHHTPFESGFFEAVFCLDVLEHIQDLHNVLAELRRILSDPGRLIVSIPMENAFYKICRFLLKGTTSMDTGPCAGRHYWQGKTLLSELESMFEVDRLTSSPLGGPFALFKVVRLRKRPASSAKPPRKASIVIPVYNERDTIQPLLQRVLNAPLAGLEREVILVDDGSTDGTRQVLEQSLDPGVRLFVHDRNRGKGAALRTAFAQATGDVVIVQDADLEYSPEEYPLLLQPILEGCAEVVYGSRYKGRDQHIHSSFAFFVGGQVVTRVANLLYGLKLTDEPTCYKVFRAALLPKLDLRCERFEFCPEFTAKVARRGIRIVEVPISYHPRTAKEGKKIRWRDGIEAIATLVRCRFVRIARSEDKPR